MKSEKSINNEHAFLFVRIFKDSKIISSIEVIKMFNNF